MRLIKPHFEILEQQPGLEGLYKQIELSGRVAYKSEDKITEDSYKGFVDRIIKLNHGAVLEHGTVYLKIPIYAATSYRIDEYKNNPYSKTQINMDRESCYYITTNMRVLVEHNWLDDLKYLCEPTKYHEKRICVKFICDRGISHEFVRHRTFSFLMESTRYCNYSKNKFGNELTFIIPCWLDYAEQQFTDKDDSSIRTDLSENEYFIDLLLEAENTYNYLVQYCGWKPQEARAILPNSLKTELVMTGFTSDWKHFFELRDAGSAHPQAQELAKPLHEEFIRRNYINE
jgi:thymidylate synthase (FAD)